MRPGSLPIGPVLWIAAGAEHLGPWAGDAPELGMDDLVQRHGPATEPGAALVGVILKAQARKAPHHFSMANDLSAIAGLVSSVEDVLGREGVPEPVGAALALVLDELLTNTVSYGFPDNGWHEILVGLDVAPGRIDLVCGTMGAPSIRSKCLNRSWMRSWRIGRWGALVSTSCARWPTRSPTSANEDGMS